MISFITMIIASLVATGVTYYGGYQLFKFMENKKLYPANHFEKKIPMIEAQIRKKGMVIFQKPESLKQMIPLEGIGYQIINEQAVIMDGSNKTQYIKDKDELLEKLNTTIVVEGKYIRIIPIINKQTKLIGAVLLIYKLTPYFFSSSDQQWIIPLFTMILLSPFIFIILFTIIFAKILSRNIGTPIQQLIEASKNIQKKNLDFEINYEADNELGKLCKVFNEMKNELKDSLISQWKSEQERSELINALAHDLKTPLSLIQGYVEALQTAKQIDQEKMTKYLKVIGEHAHRGSMLIKNMLDVAELENNTTKLHFSLINIETFLLSKKEHYELMANNKKIHFKLNITYQQQVNPTIAIDEEKLDRILDNIIMNSIRYTPDQGTITINVNVSNKKVCFKIYDTGTGFHKTDLPNLFHKFYRGDPSRTTKGHHSGLGLYIVKKLVNIHGGSIKAYNTAAGGACIEFELQIPQELMP